MDEPVADGVGDGGLADELVPRLHGDLAGDQGRGALGAILEDLEQVMALGAGQGREAPVVDHEQIGLGQAAEGAQVGAIAAGDVQLVEEPRGAHAVGRVTGAARALSEGLAERAVSAGVEFTSAAVGGMFGFFFHPGPVRSFEEAKKSSAPRFERFFREMLVRGVYLAPSAYEAGFVSLAHGPRELRATLRAAEAAFAAAAKLD